MIGGTTTQSEAVRQGSDQVAHGDPGWAARWCLAVVSVALWAPPGWAQVVISEVMPSNVDTLRDIDGNATDWIELANTGSEAVSLHGFGLSDDPQEPFKWVFPDIAIEPFQFIVVFASGKDRKTSVNDWNTVVDVGQQWRYFEGLSEPAPDWPEVEFDDSGWLTGASGFGFADGDDATVVSADTIYIRKSFDLDAQTVAEMQGGYLHVDVDDGFVAYLNGVEITRGGFGGWQRLRPRHDLPAVVKTEARLYQGLHPRGLWSETIAAVARVGENVLALQGHNVSHALDPDLDLSLIPILTLGSRTDVPDGQLSEFVEVDPIRLHTNFKLSSAGESVILTDPFGSLVDRLDFETTPVDVSVGRASPGASEVVVFNPPTPQAPNASGHRPGFASPPVLTPGGFYPSVVEVTITGEPGAEITYTLDGSEPAADSEPYTGPFVVGQEINVVRARAFVDGLWPSAIATATYMAERPLALPVVSLVMDPKDLFDPATGIYVLGEVHDPEWPYFGANVWQDWERPVHVEFWEPNGSSGFDLDAGVKIHGGYSRLYAQRSLRLILRGGYGRSELAYPVFEDYPVSEFQRLVLRNSGQDWLGSHLRDALVHTLAAPSGLDVSGYRPVTTLINGVYWGIYNLRESTDRSYVESHYGVEEVDLLELWGRVIEGDSSDYDELIDFVRENDLADDSSFAWVADRMDTEQFAVYAAMQVFFGNVDWPDSNIKFWRPSDGSGKWRWLLFDTDMGLGLANPPETDTLALLVREPSPFPGWSTELFRGLLTQPAFEIEFINRYADYLNTWLSAAVTAAGLNELVSEIEPTIGNHQRRWDDTYQRWSQEIGIIADWLDRRPDAARQHILDNFGLEGTFELTLGVRPDDAGTIRLAGITIDEEFSGTYFSGVPVSLTAEAAPGYDFAGWSDPDLPSEESIEVLPAGESYSVTALFELEMPMSSSVVINEINYNSADGFDPGDWVELFNTGSTEIDLSGWTLKDEDDGHVFTVPPGTRLSPQDYLVVCADLSAFQSLFPSVTDAIGDLGFGLGGNGDSVRLFEAAGALHDLVAYGTESPWPDTPDGQGPTLELIDPGADNRLPESWAASVAAHGTPGGANGEE